MSGEWGIGSGESGVGSRELWGAIAHASTEPLNWRMDAVD